MWGYEEGTDFWVMGEEFERLPDPGEGGLALETEGAGLETLLLLLAFDAWIDCLACFINMRLQRA